MRNLSLRLIVWFIGVPGIVAIVIFLPFANHLALNILVVVVSGLGATELAALFSRKDPHYRSNVVLVPLLGAAIPLAQLLTTTFNLSESIPYTVLAGAAGIILFIQVFRRTAEDFHHTLANIAANLTILLYPGLFLSYLIRLNEFEFSSVLILTYLCAVMGNDSMAYTAGGLYRVIRQRRATSRGGEWIPKHVFAVSPKKTIVGFAGGFVMSPVIVIIANTLFPDAIPGDWPTAILVGSVVGLATIVGDLIESAIKRSTTSKDSGELIPGRGGILDSVDSVLYAVPLFYYLLHYIV